MSEGLLNLAGADTKGFDAMPSGTYNASVFEVGMDQTKGGDDAKLPKGTPMLKVQFKIEDEPYVNRRVFRNYIIPPAKVDGKKYEHADKMKGMLVRFFMAVGYKEEEVAVDGFSPDFEDLKGRECRVSIKQREYQGEMTNDVTGVKPPGNGNGSGGLL